MDYDIYEQPQQDTILKKRSSPWKLIALIILLGIITVLSLMFFIGRELSPSDSFPVGARITIVEGSDMRTITETLEHAHVVRTSELLKLILRTTPHIGSVKAGTYIFDKPLGTQDIAEAITTGLYLEPPLRVTIPEGLRGKQIVTILEETFTDVSSTTWNAENFDEHIGYLFPDTYLLPNDFTQDDVITLMENTFEEKIQPLRPQIEQSSFSLEEIIVLASIIEREADSETSMRTVAGILLNRLDMGMPLQVDATFEYLLGKASHELTLDDLEIDSPYNTYNNRGLPPTPISNPGLMAIEAAIHPIKSDYLYYLTGSDGTFHYAKTFEEHKRNKEKYLR